MNKIFTLSLIMIVSNTNLYAQNKGGEVGNPVLNPSSVCAKKTPILIGDRISKEQIGDVFTKKGMVLSRWRDINKMPKGEYWRLENVGLDTPVYELTYIYKSVQDGEFASRKESSSDLKEVFDKVTDCEKEVASVQVQPELPNSKTSPIPKIKCTSPLPIVLDDSSSPTFEETFILWSKGFQATSSKAINEMEKGYYIEITKVSLPIETPVGKGFKYVATIKNKEDKNKTSVLGGSSSTEIFESNGFRSRIPKTVSLKEVLSFLPDCDPNPKTEVGKMVAPTAASANEVNNTSRTNLKQGVSAEEKSTRETGPTATSQK